MTRTEPAGVTGYDPVLVWVRTVVVAIADADWTWAEEG